jgi:hypothetical protein
MFIIGLMVAFFTVPVFRRDVVFVWDAGLGMLKKLFWFLTAAVLGVKFVLPADAPTKAKGPAGKPARKAKVK